jgi:hypothetical protein
MNEGPQILNIPQQSFTTCSGCKFLSHKLVRSGRDPIYAISCKHPDIKYSGHRDSGNLNQNHLGVIETPEWCPFKKQKDEKE